MTFFFQVDNTNINSSPITSKITTPSTPFTQAIEVIENNSQQINEESN